MKSGSHLIDENLSIKNLQALTLDLSHQIKLGAVGYIVALRLLSTEEILDKAPGSDSNSIMASVCKAAQDAGYGDLIYRCGEYELAFFLKSYTKPKIMDFVEEISELMRGPLEVRFIPFTPSYAYCAISYPTDAPTTERPSPSSKANSPEAKALGRAISSKWLPAIRGGRSATITSSMSSRQPWSKRRCRLPSSRFMRPAR
jgi:hypothetical protein